MLRSYSRAWCEIDYKAINHNLDEIQKLVGKTKIMGIVKANAYGHGDVACARQMAKWGVDFFGVSSIDEALNLRENGIDPKKDLTIDTSVSFAAMGGAFIGGLGDFVTLFEQRIRE